MKKPPQISEIEKWLAEKNPLGLFGGKFAVQDIDPKRWSGHFNYLIKVGKKRFVLRFKGPEWGTTKGVADEYRFLRLAARYNAGPRAYYLSQDFFGEPMILEEYLVGSFSSSAPKKLFLKVARLIAKINRIPLRNKNSFVKKQLTYKRHREVWRKRLLVILRNRRARPWGLKVKALLPKADRMLDGFETRLGRVLKKHGPSFIFESSHIGHCLVTKKGLRFLNWENVSYGDPSYTLAVFLASISKRPDFAEVKEMMIKEYLKYNPVAEFKELVQQRLQEREISNLIWVLWAYVERKETRSAGKSTDVRERLKNVETLLKFF